MLALRKSLASTQNPQEADRLTRETQSLICLQRLDGALLFNRHLGHRAIHPLIRPHHLQLHGVQAA
jgi:hypothetical protein